MATLMMNFRFGLIVAAVSTLVSSISCEHTVTPTSVFDLPDYSHIDEPAARWSAYGLKNYTIEQKRLCFCRFPHEFVKLTVKENKIVQGIDLTNGKQVPAEILQYYQTVDSLFGWIEAMKALNPERLEIEYDSRFGFPKKISFEYSAGVADDEMWIETQTLQQLSGNGDFCEALLRPQLSLDLRPVAGLYQNLYQFHIKTHEVIMFKFARSLLLGATLLCMLSCSDQPTKSETAKVQLYQIPGCDGHGLAKAATGDSCFSYKFARDLAVDFCVSANCCPDSQRFQFTHAIRHDTIVVAVADTAANLCRCMCNYVIHAEFTDLPRDRYVFCCYYGDAMVYNETVNRSLL